MNKIFKVSIGIIYLVCLSILLYLFFANFDITRINDYSYIKEKSEILIKLKNDNVIIFPLIFFIFSVIWILLLGFASPLALVSGFVFGKLTGTLISILSFTIGCTILYFLALLYFKEVIYNNLSGKFLKLKYLFNKNEFLYFFIFRLAGGGGIPFAIQNILPVIFDMKIKNYFFSTLLGLVPATFVINSLGSGIEKIIENDKAPSLIETFLSPEIYFPLIGFAIILLLSYFLKKKFFRSDDK